MKEKLDTLLGQFIFEGRCPGAAVLVVHRGEVAYQAELGRFTYELISPKVDVETIYDLASVTKIIVATAFLKLVDEGKCRLDNKLCQYFPQLNGTAAGERTVWNLLTHTSNFDIQLSQLVGNADVNKADFLSVVLGRLKVKGPAGAVVYYANINTFLLGEIIEQVTGQRLDVYIGKEVFTPLKMHNTLFNPSLDLQLMIPPTEIVAGRVIQGVVHDESARRLGGVVGHAGLFSTAGDLGNFLQMWLRGGRFENKIVLSPKMIEEALSDQTPDLNMHAGLGWRLDNPEYLGNQFPPGTFFHSGFTGTLVVGNRDKDVAVILLSNSTYPKRQKIDRMRNMFRELVEIVFAELGSD